MTRVGDLRRGWTAWLGLMLCWGLWQSASALPLADWRGALDRVRLLAENDVARAAEQARQLAAQLPPGAGLQDQARLLALQARIEHYLGHTEQAAELAERALAQAQQAGDREGQAEAYLVSALNTVNQGQFERLITVANEAVKVLAGVDRPDLMADAMLRLGMVYSRFGKPEEMVDTCVRTMNLARGSRNVWALVYAHYCMANAYSISENVRESLEQYRLMQAQAHLAGALLLEGQAIRGEAQQLGALGDATGALAKVRQASAIFRQVGAPFYLSASLYAEATLARAAGHHQQALDLLDTVADIYERQSNNTGLWWTLTARSAELQALGRLPAARADLERSLRLARALGMPLYLSESQRLLGEMAARQGDYRRAYQHALNAAELNGEANRKKLSTRVLELTERYQQQAHQREIDELTRYNEQQRAELRERAFSQRWLWTVLAAIAVVLAVLAYFLLRLRRSHRLLALANAGLQQSQQALQRQTAILQSVLDSMGDGVAVADEAGRLVLANPAAGRIVGMALPDDDWPGARQFFLPDRRTRYACDELPLLRVLRGDAAGASAEIYMTAPGLDEGRWLHMTARPLAGPQAGAVAVISDITERKRAEEEIRVLNASLETKVGERTAQLRQQTRYLRVLIDTIPWWVWFKDTDSRYVAVNRSAARVMGSDPQGVAGRTDFDLHPAVVAQAFRDDDLKVMRSGHPQTVEEVQHRPDGPLWVEIFKAPVIDIDGSVLGTVGLARDISARKEAEAARDAALLEAQRLARMRSEFLAQMSHELRTPLNAVLGFVQLLQRDPGLSALQQASVEGIGHSGNHLLALINDVLDSAQLETRKLQLFPQRLALGPFLDGIAAMMRPRAADKGLAFHCELGPGLPAVLLADEQRLRQVLLNLLSNAIKFTDRGAVLLQVQAAGPQRVWLAVRDSGIGIAAGELETIFQPFEQVGEVQRRFGGTGLGLAISRQLVRLMGGEIAVESQPGVGSVFHFTLALTAADGVLPPAAPPAPATPAAAAPAVLPPSSVELLELLKLVRIGNMRAILAHAEQLEQQDPRLRPFAELLASLARSYQSKALRQLVERYLEPDAA